MYVVSFVMKRSHLKRLATTCATHILQIIFPCLILVNTIMRRVVVDSSNWKLFLQWSFYSDVNEWVIEWLNERTNEQPFKQNISLVDFGVYVPHSCLQVSRNLTEFVTWVRGAFINIKIKNCTGFIPVFQVCLFRPNHHSHFRCSGFCGLAWTSVWCHSCSFWNFFPVTSSSPVWTWWNHEFLDD